MMENNQSLNYKLLQVMRRIRDVEMFISHEYKNQQIRCPVHLSIGQEGPAAAVSLNIKKTDYSVSTHRGHAHYIAKGGNLKRMISELYGKESGCSKGKGGSMHLIDKSVGFMGTSAIVGNSIPTGTGLAEAAKLNGYNQISVIHIGDGAIEEGSFYESLNYACVKKLPAIYLCENNFYSVYSPLSVRQPSNRNLGELAKAIGSEYIYKGNGNDPIKAYEILKEAIQNCRQGNGPAFIEFETYRWLEHCGPNDDDNLNYRNKKEILEWKNKDPIVYLENSLTKLEFKQYQNFRLNLSKEISDAFKFAKESMPPNPLEAYTDIYASE